MSKQSNGDTIKNEEAWENLKEIMNGTVRYLLKMSEVDGNPDFSADKMIAEDIKKALKFIESARKLTYSTTQTDEEAFDKCYPYESYTSSLRSDLRRTWQAACVHKDAQRNVIDKALLNAAYILANFTAGEAHEDGTLPRKLEEWQACYAKLFTQMNELVQESQTRRKQVEQKVVELVDNLNKIERCTQETMTGKTSEFNAILNAVASIHVITSDWKGL